MDIFANLALGFGVVLTPTNLLVALVGCFIGTAVGVLPGLGPTATISLLLPISVYLDRTSSIILMSGVYYGAMYGGSITSILIKIPGEAASVVTCLDGYQMARRGRAGAALGISALASFFAGIVATLGIAWLGPKMASVALMFGPVEKASLLLLGLILILGVGEGSKTRALAMVGLGLLFGTIGVDLVSGEERFVFDIPQLRDGFGIAVVAMGLFGISEVLMLAEEQDEQASSSASAQRCRSCCRTRPRRGVHLAGDARQRARLLPRPVARRRRDARELCELHDGAEALTPAGTVRQGRGRRRRRTGSGQQRRRAGELHSPALPRHPGQRGDRRHHGRAADGGRHARTKADHRTPASCSGASSPACWSATSCWWCSTSRWSACSCRCCGCRPASCRR